MIKINPDGSMTFLYKDELMNALKDEGTSSVTRASDLKYNNFTRKWEVFHPGSDVKMFEEAFEHRADALKAEEAFIEKTF